MATDNTDKAAKDAARAAAKKRLTEALAQREADHADVETAFWTKVRDEIDSGALRQVDAVDALGFTREYIRKQLKNLPE
ncbi:hypothetical protein [Kitasatospora cathayae]|uniref:Uncharacterized protein n=1 Tax=Kitasatospora cathayae TaxID=3004092 RepID=A0ABY7QHC1_9ACTN|nr:hypothetical protein [Kitasatospora sp. HUAS 3-15]WBP92195.1 hypothetical protein O1G21_41030 [Kitasatospora sp. HUAS 3-15]